MNRIRPKHTVKDEIQATKDGNEIKLARLDAGLTQQQVSDILEIPKRTLEAWESGSRKPPVYVEKLVIEKIRSLREASKNGYVFESESESTGTTAKHSEK